MTITSVPITSKPRKLRWKWRQEGYSTLAGKIVDEDSEPLSEDDLDKLAALSE